MKNLRNENTKVRVNGNTKLSREDEIKVKLQTNKQKNNRPWIAEITQNNKMNIETHRER